MDEKIRNAASPDWAQEPANDRACGCGWGFNCNARTGIVVEDGPFDLRDPGREQDPVWPHDIDDMDPEQEEYIDEETARAAAYEWGRGLEDMAKVVHQLLAFISTLRSFREGPEHLDRMPVLLNARLRATDALKGLGAHNPFGLPAPVAEFISALHEAGASRFNVQEALRYLGNQGLDAEKEACRALAILSKHGLADLHALDEDGRIKDPEV